MYNVRNCGREGEGGKGWLHMCALCTHVYCGGLDPAVFVVVLVLRCVVLGDTDICFF